MSDALGWVHIWNCEGLGVRFPRATRLLALRGLVCPKSGKIDLTRKFVLSFRLLKEMASRRGSLGNFARPKRSPKPLLDCSGQGCRIILYCISKLFCPGAGHQVQIIIFLGHQAVGEFLNQNYRELACGQFIIQ